MFVNSVRTIKLSISKSLHDDDDYRLYALKRRCSFDQIYAPSRPMIVITRRQKMSNTSWQLLQ